MASLQSPKLDPKEKCPICSKRVYQAERIQAEASGDIYFFHKSCFRCAACNSVLKPGAYATEGKKFFCKPHIPKASSKRPPVVALPPPIVVETLQVVMSANVPTDSSSNISVDRDTTSPRVVVTQPSEIKSGHTASSSSPASGSSPATVTVAPIHIPLPAMASPSSQGNTPPASVSAAAQASLGVTAATNGSWSQPAGQVAHSKSAEEALPTSTTAVVPPLQIGRKNTRPPLPPLSPDSSSQAVQPTAAPSQLPPPPVQPQPKSLKEWLQTAPSTAKLAALQQMKLEQLQHEAKRDKHVASPFRDGPIGVNQLSYSTSALPNATDTSASASNPNPPAPANGDKAGPKRVMMSPIRLRTVPEALKSSSPVRPEVLASPRSGIQDDGELFSPRLEETQLRSSRDPSTPAIVQDVATLRTELTKAHKDHRSLKKEVRRREEDLKQLRRDVREHVEAMNQLRTYITQLDSEKHLMTVEAKLLAQEAKQFAVEARQMALEANRSKDDAAQARREVTELRQELSMLQQRVLDLESRPAALPSPHVTAAVAAAAVGRARAADATSLMARALENDVAAASGSLRASPRGSLVNSSPATASSGPAASLAPAIFSFQAPTSAPQAPAPMPAVAVVPPAAPPATSAPTPDAGQPKPGPAYPPPKTSMNTLKKSEDDAKRFAPVEYAPVKKITNEDIAAMREQTAGRKVREFYEIGKRLAKGGQSIVFQGTQKSSGKKVAVKKIKRSSDPDEEAGLWREISLLKHLSHPNIVKFYEFFEEENFIYLVMEFIDGKELFDKIVDKGAYSERDAAVVVRQVVDAIAYLHANHIAHRDIKPENILSSGSGPTEIVKLADFGLSKNFDAGPLQTLCGSSLYIAPELLEDSKYDNSVDMWSLGVVVYILLCGQSPWKSPPTEANKLLQDIIGCKWDFEKEEWKFVSPEAKDFISKLLRKEPTERMTAQQCLAHPWLQQAGSKAVNNKQQLNNTLTRLKDFTYGRKAAKNLMDLFDPPTAPKEDEKT